MNGQIQARLQATDFLNHFIPRGRGRITPLQRLRTYVPIGGGVYQVRFVPSVGGRRRNVNADLMTSATFLLDAMDRAGVRNRDQVFQGFSRVDPGRFIDDTMTLARRLANGPAPNSWVWVAVQLSNNPYNEGAGGGTWVSIPFIRGVRFNSNMVLNRLEEHIQSSTRAFVSSVTISWTAPPPYGGGGIGGSNFSMYDSAGKNMKLNPPSYGADDHSCAPRALIILEKYNLLRIARANNSGVDGAFKEWTTWLRYFKSNELYNKRGSMKIGGRKMLQEATKLCESSGVDINTPSSLDDIKKMVVQLSLRMKTPCAIKVFDWDNGGHIILDTADYSRDLQPAPVLEKIPLQGEERKDSRSFIINPEYDNNGDYTIGDVPPVLTEIVDSKSLFKNHQTTSSSSSSSTPEFGERRAVDMFNWCEEGEVHHGVNVTMSGGDVTSSMNEREYTMFYLILTGGHYIGVKKMNGIIGGQRYWCEKCQQTSSLPLKMHKCKKRCKHCTSKFDHEWERRAIEQWNIDNYEKGVRRQPLYMRECKECGCRFRGDDCFAYHLEIGSCGDKWRCFMCSKVFKPTKRGNTSSSDRTRDQHRCNEYFCTNCRSFSEDEATHECFMKCKKPQRNTTKYLFADFESTQDPPEYFHVVNMACTHTFDGRRWPALHSIEAWVDELLTSTANGGVGWWGYTVIFHNGRGYDFQFIFAELLKKKRAADITLDDPVMTGSKILFMQVSRGKRFGRNNTIRFVDSLNFLTMSLSKFPSTFDLNQTKGDFPHLFNTSSNKDYVGKLPAPHYFGRDNMVSGVEEFDKWHAEESERVGDNWNLMVELERYCQRDVEVHRLGCTKFRSIVMACTQPEHDPFQERTLAGSSMAIFRTMFLNRSVECQVACMSRKTAVVLRKAFFGGRTGPTKLYYKCGMESRMQYVDFTSLYPWVNKNSRYPIGHPQYYSFVNVDTILVQPRNINDIHRSIHPWVDDESLSIWSVDIEPPQDLYLPVLPSKDTSSGLLFFDLRHKKQKLYTNVELRLAQQMGYIITKVYEVWYWDVSKTAVGLMRGYVNMWLKIKQESAGYSDPDGRSVKELIECKDPAFFNYVHEYMREEGIQLNAVNIAKNKGMYKTSKLFLNSLWGKFAQRLSEEFSKTSVFRGADDTARWYEMLSNYDVNCVRIVNESTVLASCRQTKPRFTTSGDEMAFRNLRVKNSNIAVAIFTTSHARIHLYRAMVPLGKRVIYYDTDSIIFVHKKNEDPSSLAPLGKYLGDLTSEIGDDSYSYSDKCFITEFVSTGPKSYAYKTSDGKTTVKVKGLALHSQATAQERINFEALKKVVIDSSAFTVNFRQFKRTALHEVQTNFNSPKILRDVFVKRKKLPLTCGPVPVVVDIEDNFYIPPPLSLFRSLSSNGCNVPQGPPPSPNNSLASTNNFNIPVNFLTLPDWELQIGDSMIDTVPWCQGEKPKRRPTHLKRLVKEVPCWFAWINSDGEVQTSVTNKLISTIISSERKEYVISRVDGFTTLESAMKFNHLMKLEERISSIRNSSLSVLQSFVNLDRVVNIALNWVKNDQFFVTVNENIIHYLLEASSLSINTNASSSFSSSTSTSSSGSFFCESDFPWNTMFQSSNDIQTIIRDIFDSPKYDILFSSTDNMDVSLLPANYNSGSSGCVSKQSSVETSDIDTEGSTTSSDTASNSDDDCKSDVFMTPTSDPELVLRPL